MGSVILIGVLADQQFAKYRKRSLAQAVHASPESQRRTESPARAPDAT
jgi:hypothetical protein